MFTLNNTYTNIYNNTEKVVIEGIIHQKKRTTKRNGKVWPCVYG